MPLHDWTRVPSGIFHDFHQSWSIRLKDALNAGRLPKGLSALVEQRYGSREADVLTVEGPSRSTSKGTGNGAPIQTLQRPVTRYVRKSDKEIYAGRANRIVVKHHLGRVVAVIEIVSPGNKDSRAAVRDFVEKSVEYLKQGIHLLLIDLFPPTPRDPLSLHKLIWDEFKEEEFVLPPGKDRLLASYEIGHAERTAFVEPVGVGDALPEMPLFYAPEMHLMTPLESTYMSAWNASPEEMRIVVETGVLPTVEDEEAQ
jgi:hypothetical protein